MSLLIVLLLNIAIEPNLCIVGLDHRTHILNSLPSIYTD